MRALMACVEPKAPTHLPESDTGSSGKAAPAVPSTASWSPLEDNSERVKHNKQKIKLKADLKLAQEVERVELKPEGY